MKKPNTDLSIMKGRQHSQLTQPEIDKASYMARRIQQGLNCTNDQAMKAAIGYVKEFGTT